MTTTTPRTAPARTLKTTDKAPLKSGLTASHSHPNAFPTDWMFSRRSSICSEVMPKLLSIRSNMLSAPLAKPIKSSMAKARLATPTTIAVTGKAAILTATPNALIAATACLIALIFFAAKTAPNPIPRSTNARAFSPITLTISDRPSSSFVTAGRTMRTRVLPTACDAVLKSIHATLKARAVFASCAVKAVLRYLAIRSSSAFWPCKKMGMASVATPCACR